MSEFIDTLRDPSNSSLVCKVLVLDAAAKLEQMTAEVRDAFYSGHGAGWSCGIADIEPTLSQRDSDYQIWLKRSVSGSQQK